MSKRRLGDLPRAVDITRELDPISGGHHHRIGGQSIRFDRHARRDMDDSANPSIFRDGESAARIIPSHHPSRRQPVATAKRRFLEAGPSSGRSFIRFANAVVGHIDHDGVSPRHDAARSWPRSVARIPDRRSPCGGISALQVPITICARYRSPERRIDGHDR